MYGVREEQVVWQDFRTGVCSVGKQRWWEEVVAVCVAEAGSEWPWKCRLALFSRFLSKEQQDQLCVLESRFRKRCPFGRVVGASVCCPRTDH